jgi:hypothetical protein
MDYKRVNNDSRMYSPGANYPPRMQGVKCPQAGQGPGGQRAVANGVCVATVPKSVAAEEDRGR